VSFNQRAAPKPLSRDSNLNCLYRNNASNYDFFPSLGKKRKISLEVENEKKDETLQKPQLIKNTFSMWLSWFSIDPMWWGSEFKSRLKKYYFSLIPDILLLQ